MVYIVTHNRTTLAATTNHTDALDFAQRSANLADRPGEAIAHLLVEAWNGMEYKGAEHVYAQRQAD